MTIQLIVTLVTDAEMEIVTGYTGAKDQIASNKETYAIQNAVIKSPVVQN